jgi:hypothetical protein
MTHPSDSPHPPDEPLDQTLDKPPMHHTGIGITQWLTFGLLAFSLLAVVIAVVINLFPGNPGG